MLLFGRIPSTRISIPLKISGALVLTSLTLLTITYLAGYRGLIQRPAEAEIVLFGWLTLASAVQLASAYLGRNEIVKGPK